MNIYERIDKKELHIPCNFDMSVMQMNDIRNNAPSLFDIMYVCFKFGYMQGIRSEQARKGNNHGKIK